MADNDTLTNPVAAGGQASTLQSSVPVKHFAFMNHFWQGSAGSPVSLTPALANPGFLTHSGVTPHTQTAPQKGLQNILDDMMTDHQRQPGKPQIEKLRFALVDLTEGKLLTPQFAGHRATTQGGLGSTAKMGVMFGIFQLLFDLNAFAKLNATIADEASLFSAIRAEWGKTQARPASPTVAALHPGNARVPKMELQDRLVKIEPTFNKEFTFPLPLHAQIGAPKLENMFTAVAGTSGGALEVRFKGTLGMTQGAQDYINNTPDNLKEVRKLSHPERLAIMIDESDNPASQTCVEDIGYLYINSALWQADFFSPERDGGLWVASTFNDKNLRWVQSPVPDRLQPDAFTACTPAAIAAMATLIAQNRMISPEISKQMRDLMNKRKTGLQRKIAGLMKPVGSFSRSFFREGLIAEDPDKMTKARFKLDEVFSKLGIGNRFGDCMIVKRTDRGKELRYVAVGLDDEFVEKLHELIIVLDMAIQQNNGLTPLDKPAPAPAP